MERNVVSGSQLKRDVRWVVGETFDAVPDPAIAGMGAYTRLFCDWTPARTAVPTLLLRATEAAAEQDWPLPHDCLRVPGDHFTVLNEHTATTVDAIRTWETRWPPPVDLPGRKVMVDLPGRQVNRGAGPWIRPTHGQHCT
ncbi:hypothetical protein [Amycolatopsis magusensis]|uniref:hypothetical protein n=1 Tax=Amycolatopsis magusensis TaxID=882444 RepID=UPI0024A7D14D|nr:hypothetical protein [Amycolatopsis magusensis]MDI5976475.1 hypothetical protein [Amycolatopsis magusensis]